MPEVRAVAERGYPVSEVSSCMGGRRAERTYSTFKVRRGGHEEIPLVQGKEQRPRFAVAAVKIPHVQGKRNPSEMVDVARGHQRTDTLKP